jgi:hypothetical protein
MLQSAKREGKASHKTGSTLQGRHLEASTIPSDPKQYSRHTCHMLAQGSKWATQQPHAKLVQAAFVCLWQLGSTLPQIKANKDTRIEV